MRGPPRDHGPSAAPERCSGMVAKPCAGDPARARVASCPAGMPRNSRSANSKGAAAGTAGDGNSPEPCLSGTDGFCTERRTSGQPSRTRSPRPAKVRPPRTMA
jgi:hypothetical protein